MSGATGSFTVAGAALLRGLERASGIKATTMISGASSDWGGLDPETLDGLVTGRNDTSLGPDAVGVLMDAERLAGTGKPGGRVQNPFAAAFGWEPSPREHHQTPPSSNASVSMSAPPAAPVDQADPRPALSVDHHDPGRCVEHLLAVARRYGSARAGPSGASLFDESRVAAAIAATGLAAGPSRRCRFVLLGFGGIQRFIFRSLPVSDSSGGAERGRAKTLRAKSFFLSLLMFDIVRTLLARLGLPPVNALYETGGRAALLVPANSADDDSLRQVLAELRAWHIKHFAGVLDLRVGVGEPLDWMGLKSGPEAWRGAEAALKAARTYFAADAFRDENGWAEDGWVFESSGLPTDTGEFARAMIDVGAALPRTAGVVLHGNDKKKQLQVFSGSAALCRNCDTLPPDAYRIAGRNDMGQPTPTLSAGRYVPMATPDDAASSSEEDDLQPGQPLSFNMLAGRSRDELGHPVPHAMLGALKADMDRLGYLMSYGLGDDATLARVVGASRMLDEFFHEFLEERLREAYPSVYTVFSGGDDLFLIGPWLDMARFAVDLRTWFSSFVDGNRKVTISAGLAFCKPHTPVRAIADAAEDALERSKDYGRDRISTIGCTVSWSIYAKAIEMRRVLTEAVGTDHGPGRSMLHRLLRYAEMARRSNAVESGGGEVRLADAKWRSQLAYDVQRNIPPPRDATSDHPAVRLRETLLAFRSEDADLIRIAATLALYTIRGDNT